MSLPGRGRGALTTPRVPDAPTAVSAVTGNTQAVVSFTPPAANGGPAPTSYVVTASPGGATAAGGASPITVTGLVNGTSYTFTVKAVNFFGQSAASGISNAVIPYVLVTPPDWSVTNGPGPNFLACPTGNANTWSTPTTPCTAFVYGAIRNNGWTLQARLNINLTGDSGKGVRFRFQDGAFADIAAEVNEGVPARVTGNYISAWYNITAAIAANLQVGGHWDRELGGTVFGPTINSGVIQFRWV